MISLGMQPNVRAVLRAAVLGLAALLVSACGSSPSSDWTASTAHLSVTVNGPGLVIIASDTLGEITCREHSVNPHCYIDARIADGETVTITAVADEGHEFISWLKHPNFKWTDELTRNSNPVLIALDGDYQLYANFR